MFVVWYKELTAIDICNKMIQARDATLEIKLCHRGGGVGPALKRKINPVTTLPIKT
jgi:hypothetical protein